METAAVLRFLQDHPDFLRQHADTLGIRLRESKIRTFSEAQLAAADKKVDTIAQHMAAMTESAERNLTTIRRLMRLNLALMGCNTLKQLDSVLTQSLCEDFQLPNFVWFLLCEPVKKLRIPPAVILPAGDAARTVLTQLNHPVCAHHALHKNLETRLPERTQAESFLHLPLRFQDKTLGILLLGHPDPDYFAPDSPTEYVALMGDALGATLARMMGLRTA